MADPFGETCTKVATKFAAEVVAKVGTKVAMKFGMEVVVKVVGQICRDSKSYWALKALIKFGQEGLKNAKNLRV